jgi:DNA-binding beta-propeller fold protein YncE
VPVPGWAKGKHIHFFPSAVADRKHGAGNVPPEEPETPPGSGLGTAGPSSQPAPGSFAAPPRATRAGAGKRSSANAASRYLVGRRCQRGYCPNVPLYYYGGKIQTEPAVHVIFWGRNWNTEPGLQQRKELMAFFESLSSSPWQGIMTQYFQLNEGKIGYIGHNVKVDSFVDERETAPGEGPGTEVSGKHIEEEVHYAVTHQPAEHPWARGVNSQFTVIPAPGTKYEPGFSEGFCAYHGDVTEEGVTSTFQFDPYDGEEPFYHQCIGYDEHGIANHVTSMLASHEYGETATDPELNAWLDTQLFEIGDICSIVPGTNLVDGGWVQGLWDDHEGACVLEDNAPPHVFAETEYPKSSSRHEAIVQALINPEGLETQYHFQYGLTSSYEGAESGSTTPVNAGSGTAFSPISQTISGLRLETTYHYRVVATNSSGTTYGEDRTVSTSAWNAATPPLPEGATSGTLADVSCPSSSWCMALGGSSLGTPYADRWTSGTWSELGIPLPAGQAETLNNIRDVAVDPSTNNVWVTDFAHDRLVELSPKREVLEQIGGEGTGNGQFKDPWGIGRSSSSGNVWVADYENSRVEEFTAAGEFVLAVGWGVEDGAAKAEVCHSTSTCRAGIAGEGPGQFEHPQGVAVDNNGDVWVSDPASGRLEEFNGEGKYTTQIGSLGQPAGVAADGAGNVWVAEETANRVTEFSSAGAFVRTFGWGVADGAQKLETCATASLAECRAGTEGSGKGQFARADDVTVDEGGHLWVINDQWYWPIQEFKPEGATGEVKYVTSTSNTFYFPQALDAGGGSLYTSDPASPLLKWALPTTEGNGITYVARFVEAVGPGLNGISCTSSTACVAVGEGDPRSFEGSAPLAETWDGTKWTLQTLSASSSGDRDRLHEVSCWSANECMAVGVAAGSENPRPFSELWKGGSWTPESVPVPEGFVGSDLRGVSCASATFCLAVGQRLTTEVESAYGERWDGTKWTPVPISTSGNFPFGNKFSWLESVVCTSTTWCMGVGNESFGGGEGWQSIAARWTGSELVLLRTPTEHQNGLNRISCPAQETCVATGGHEIRIGSGEWGAIIDILNGTTWSNQAAAVEGTGSGLGGVSCVLTAQCITVGVSNSQPLALERPPLPKPGATTGAATELGYRKATLTGTVTPNNWSSKYYFEYGTSTSYGSKAPVPEAMVNSETTAEEVKQSITGLEQATTYHFRLVASNSGNATYGEDKTFATETIPAPTVTTGTAKSITWDTAVLTGTVTPNHFSPTTYYFEYGPTTTYGFKVPVPEAALKSEAGESVSEMITGLVPSKIYHYRLVASNEGKLGNGKDKTLTTKASGFTAAFTSAFGSAGSEAGQLGGAQGDAVDPNGNVWVGDTANNRVDEFAASGAFKMALGWGVADGSEKLETCTTNCKAGLTGPGNGEFGSGDFYGLKIGGIAVTGADVWVVDGGNDRIEEFTTSGAFVTKIATLVGPEGIASTPSGDVWVSSEGYGALQEFAPDGTEVHGWTLTYQNPKGLGVDPQGNVWVAQTSFNRLAKYSPQGAFELYLGWHVNKNGSEKLETCTSECQAGTAGAGAGQFNYANYVSVDGNGDVWVTDAGNNRVQELSPTGEYIAQFGSAGSGSGQFSSPQGIAVASSLAYVVDGNNNRVEKWNLSVPTYSSSFGALGTGAGQLSGPQGEAVDSNGNVWVADTANNRVDEFTSAGEFKLAFGWGVKDGKAKAETCTTTTGCKAGLLGTGNGEFGSGGPYDLGIGGVAVSGSDVWVVDGGNDRVEEFTTGGAYVTKIGTLVGPEGIAATPSGDVWVSSYGYGALQEFAPNGTEVHGFTLTYQNPKGLGVDPEGNVWVAQPRNNRIAKYSPQGAFELYLGWHINKNGAEQLETCTSECQAGTAGTGEGQFSWPTYVAVDAAGNLWVTDSGNNRVQEFDLNGQPISLFGSAGSGSGQFSNPEGVAVASGSAYVVDSGNNRVEKWGVLE